MAPLLTRLFTRRTFIYVASGTALTTAGGLYYLSSTTSSTPYPPIPTTSSRRPPPAWTPPSREEMLAQLRASGSGTILPPGSLDEGGKEGSKGTITVVDKEGDIGEDVIFDLLVIGGGATGAGVALDAASRGLKVALVERDDFSAGTSSKSTKLVHGGVRYLQKAVFELDYSQYKLVREALHERKIFLQTAPYLSEMLPIMLPIYKYWQVPYYYAGCKMYDMLAGKENMESSYLMSKGKALEAFPMLKSDGLVGALVYYDGQHNDSRMNIALILTAIQHGATALNYTEVTALLKSPTTQRLTGALVRDTLTSTTFPVRARGVINATGPFTDALLTMDDPAHTPICMASSGVHITLPGYYSPRTMGLLDPETSDGRVIFFLPWQGNTIAGTTDSPSRVVREPEATEEDVRWVLDEVRRYLSGDIKVRRGDVLSAWSGLRPLVRDPEAVARAKAQAEAGENGNGNASGKTAGLVRSHVTFVSKSGLLTIAGGKWTTYRKMAEETVDEAVEVFGLGERCKVSKTCVTEGVRLVGSEGWSRNMFIGLIQTYGLETEVAKHLSQNYGSRAWTVASLAPPTHTSWPLHGHRLSPSYPFIDAEILYAIKHEYACTAIDVLARRTRLSFLNARAALDGLPGVVGVMGKEMGWDKARREGEVRRGVEFLVGSMGLVGDVDEIVKEVLKDPAVWSAGGAGINAPRGSGWLSAAKGLFGFGGWRASHVTHTSQPAGGEVEVRLYGRARFGPGEIVELRKAFAGASRGRETIGLDEVKEVVKNLPGYEGVTRGDWDYVVEEAGLLVGETNTNEKQVDTEIGSVGGVDLDDFIEICGGLKDVGVKRPAEVGSSAQRVRIPVEKSGGGV